MGRNKRIEIHCSFFVLKLNHTDTDTRHSRVEVSPLLNMTAHHIENNALI